MKTLLRNRCKPSLEIMEARQLATVGLAHPGQGSIHVLTTNETFAVVGLKNTTSAVITVEVIGVGFEPRTIHLPASNPGLPAASPVAVYVPHKADNATKPVFVFKFNSEPTGKRKEVTRQFTNSTLVTVPKGRKPTVSTAPVYSFRLSAGVITLS